MTDVEVRHTFCVTKNISTPLILGMDFLMSTNALPDPLYQRITFRNKEDNGDNYDIPTHSGDGLYRSIPNSMGGLDLEGDLVIPLSVSKSKENGTLKTIKLEKECSFDPGASQLLWLGLKEEMKDWEVDTVLQPAPALFSKHGIYLVPTLFTHGVEEQYCAIMLYAYSSVPVEVDIIESIDEVCEVLSNKYINYHDEDEAIAPPTFLEGPIFKPTKAYLQAVGMYTTRMNEQCRVNSIRYGPERPSWLQKGTREDETR
ncbi:hypothetical protein G6F37_012429 [Rhizopus arrhizus]|nr:hypothetical protein G6F38_012460 [Rhizopus arrhizus]KAG1143680.1 hypothetical protein G6F37_012429 [Rhizopus arrhizus]